MLSPFLWADYDDTVRNMDVPPEVLQAQSHHLRFLHLTNPWPTTHPLNATFLRCISVSGEALDSYRSLLTDNSAHLLQLSLLDFDRFVPNEPLPPLYLPRLARLRIQGCILNLFSKSTSLFVNANSHLTHLTVTYVHNWRWQTPEFTSWNLFPNLTSLTFDTKLDTNDALVQLTRRCPALETLAIAPYANRTDKVYSTLSRNLRECCTSLKAIKALNASNVLLSDETMWEEDCISMIQASPRLMQMELAVETVRFALCNRLVELHGDWLETVALHMVTGTKFSFASANEVLRSCVMLVSFEMHLMEWCWRIRSNMDLFRRRWNCPRLARFKLEMDLEFMRDISVYDWTLGSGPEEDEDVIYPRRMRLLRGWVFERLVDLPRMQSISIDDYKYERRMSESLGPSVVENWNSCTGSGLKLRSYTGDCLALSGASKILHFCNSLVSEISFGNQSQSLGTVQSLF
ncbi:hypothetical protein BG006_004527 [Podila minutissima]|uniref:F-box protein n=1 Tax=Podila minutissima TaxID=64525 RepID=A0A9P5VMB2_9FUNG|nr:hypothetical protein BG006_004527 [Podila minutissima]